MQLAGLLRRKALAGGLAVHGVEEPFRIQTIQAAQHGGMKSISQQRVAPAHPGKPHAIALVERLHADVERAASRSGPEPRNQERRKIFHKLQAHMAVFRHLGRHGLAGSGILPRRHGPINRRANTALHGLPSQGSRRGGGADDGYGRWRRRITQHIAHTRQGGAAGGIIYGFGGLFTPLIAG